MEDKVPGKQPLVLVRPAKRISAMTAVERREFAAWTAHVMFTRSEGRDTKA